MREFLHGQAQQLLSLMVICNDLLGKYNDRDLNLGVALAHFLGEAAKTYHDIGRQDVEGRLLSLKAELSTAQRGVNPFTYQTTIGRRRELEATVSFKVLQAISEQIGSDLQKGERGLHDGRAMLVPLLLAAVQKGFITDPATTGGSALAIEALWRMILADAEIGIVAKRVALTLSLPDTVLLLEDMLADLNLPPVNSAPEGPIRAGKRLGRTRSR